VSPNDNFKRELNNAIDDVSGAPSSGLRDRVRAAVTETRPERSTYWIAAVAACLITAVIVGILYMNNPFRRPVGTVNPGATPSPSASPSTQPTPSPSPTPTTAYICTADTMDHTLPTGSPIAYANDIKTGAHDADGYERLVITFANGIPTESVELKPQTGTTFVLGESGQTVKLKGKNGIEVVIKLADAHTEYHGTTDFVTSSAYTALAEARVVEDFEGVIRVGIGVKGPACYHAFYLTSPYRLVIDVQAAG
jgi:hypothetical protein